MFGMKHMIENNGYRCIKEEDIYKSFIIELFPDRKRQEPPKLKIYPFLFLL